MIEIKPVDEQSELQPSTSLETDSTNEPLVQDTTAQNTVPHLLSYNPAHQTNSIEIIPQDTGATIKLEPCDVEVDCPPKIDELGTYQNTRQTSWTPLSPGSTFEPFNKSSGRTLLPGKIPGEFLNYQKLNKLKALNGIKECVVKLKRLELDSDLKNQLHYYENSKLKKIEKLRQAKDLDEKLRLKLMELKRKKLGLVGRISLPYQEKDERLFWPYYPTGTSANDRAKRRRVLGIKGPQDAFNDNLEEVMELLHGTEADVDLMFLSNEVEVREKSDKSYSTARQEKEAVVDNGGNLFDYLTTESQSEGKSKGIKQDASKVTHSKKITVIEDATKSSHTTDLQQLDTIMLDVDPHEIKELTRNGEIVAPSGDTEKISEETEEIIEGLQRFRQEEGLEGGTSEERGETSPVEKGQEALDSVRNLRDYVSDIVDSEFSKEQDVKLRPSEGESDLDMIPERKNQSRSSARMGAQKFERKKEGNSKQQGVKVEQSDTSESDSELSVNELPSEKKPHMSSDKKGMQQLNCDDMMDYLTAGPTAEQRIAAKKRPFMTLEQSKSYDTILQDFHTEAKKLAGKKGRNITESDIESLQKKFPGYYKYNIKSRRKKKSKPYVRYPELFTIHDYIYGEPSTKRSDKKLELESADSNPSSVTESSNDSLPTDPEMDRKPKVGRPRRAATNMSYVKDLDGNGSDTQEYSDGRSDEEWKPDIKLPSTPTRSRSTRQKSKRDSTGNFVDKSEKAEEVKIKAQEICGKMQQIHQESVVQIESGSSDSESDSDSELKQRQEEEDKKHSEAMDNMFEAYLFS